MNTEPQRKPARADRPLVRAFKGLPRKFWGVLSHNLMWKLLALVLAVSLWAGLITQDPTLTRERVFTDVPVSVTGSDALRRNGFIVVSDMDASTAAVRLRVDVPQREYNSVTASNYNPRIDLSKITETGEQTLKISTTSTTTYGTVAEVYPESISVTVDRYVTSYRLPITVRQTGGFPSGFYGASPTLDPSVVSVSGPESVVSRIARVAVDFDASRLPAQAGLVRTALPMTYEDEDGNVLDDTFIEASTAGVLLRSIVVEQQLYPTKSLSLNALTLTSGTPAEGYEVKSVTPSPNVLIAAGDETALSALDSLFLEHAVDVSNRDASFAAEVKVRKPSELVYLSTDSVMLSVEIGPTLVARDFADVPLTLSGTDSGLSAESQTKAVSVTVTGPKLQFDTLKASALQAYVSTAGLAPGTYALPVQLSIRNAEEQSFTYAITPQNVSVTITDN
ncbi:MAG: hypothetical protein GX418_01840 [Clostridiales bacterium]|nr:hypothetical protein [Clostridiales bacterium]